MSRSRQNLSRRAFTLIELLVVISIIALLIAILLPALSKSRYQAKVSECRSTLRQTGIGAAAYATDSDDLLPMHQYDIHKPSAIRSPSFDYRTTLDGYIEFGLLQCPVAPGVIDIAGSNADNIESTYLYYWSWKWNPVAGVENQPLERLDSRMTFGDAEFDILAADLAVESTSNSETAHPFEGADAFEWEEETFGGATYTFKRWNSWGRARTTPIERNFLRTDGSVQTYGSLSADHSQYDEMTRVPVFRGESGRDTYLPKR